MKLPFSLSRPSVPLLIALLCSRAVYASYQLNLDDRSSIKNVAKDIAAGMVKYYTGYRPGDVPGNVPDPYHWWEAGAMFSALIDYWYYTGDSQYNEITTQAMLHQVGDDKNYMPANQSKSLGNDDQGFWGMAAMTAAETKYPNPPKDQPQWLELAQAVYNSQVPRWNTETCGGGLRWQVFPFHRGYRYKNTISNGCFFNLASRLALYTGNKTYAEQAIKHWDWMSAVGLISPSFQIFDGSDTDLNCTKLNHIQWTYNTGVLMAGAAALYNHTNGSEVWKKRVEGLIDGGGIFFVKEPPNVMSEVACENGNTCNIDQRSFKAYLARWMALTMTVAPFTREKLMPRLSASALAAAQQCNGPNNACGLRWTRGAAYDGSTGIGEQMSALEVIQSHLFDTVPGPANNETGISKGDPNAGSGSNTSPDFRPPSDITTADKVGAGFLTVIVLCSIIGSTVWVIS